MKKIWLYISFFFFYLVLVSFCSVLDINFFIRFLLYFLLALFFRKRGLFGG